VNVAENMLLQVQGMASLPKTGSTGAKDKTGSFQDLMDQAGKDSVDTGKEPKDPSTTDQPANSEKTEGESAPKAPVQKKDGQKVDETQIDPNAVLLTMFRPEIVEVQPETMEAVAETLETVVPVEAEAQAEVPVMETEAAPVQEETAPVVEMPVEMQETAAEEAPEIVAVETAKPAETERPQASAQQDAAVEITEKTTETGELKEVRPAEETEKEQPQGEGAELTDPQVFQDVKAPPVKVAENYRAVDTQEPEMDSKLANLIQDAAQNGVEKMQIQLSPENLGQITIDLARDAEGALEVVIRASNSKAAGLLSQHLDGLHTALQSYGSNQSVHVEVQRSQESPEQHMFQQADPDGRGQQQRQQQEKRQETEDSSEDFMQKLRLGLTSLTE